MRPALASLLGLAVLAAFTGTLPGQTNLEGQLFPQQALPKSVQGAEIPSALGAKLPQIAAWYGQSEAELRASCCNDKSLIVDRSGRLLYACRGHLPSGPAPSRPGPSPRPSSLRTFLLHSRPGSKRVIYLDFDGHKTTGTVWNKYVKKSMMTPPYTSDDGAEFSESDLANIELIWSIVAEDFAPFNVDVTTQNPGIEALRKKGSSDGAYGIRVCIGGSSMDWLEFPAGGVALLNSFAWDSDTPAFVFPAELGGGNPKYVGDTISHEVGHTLNLMHDGQGTTEYYEGHGDWAPIMGASFDKSVAQWSKGEYENASNKQNDIALISRYCPVVPDQHVSNVFGATNLAGDEVRGLIETRSDADMFRIFAGAGSLSLTALPATIAPNLDIVMSLYDGFGDLVTTVAGAGMDSSLSEVIQQGTYYVAIEGGGNGTPSTGYSEYASIGQYSLKALFSPPTSRPPVAVAESSRRLVGLAPLTVTFSGTRSSDPDGFIASYNWDFDAGDRSDLASPTFTYTTPGIYTASLVVTDDGGLSSAPATIRVVVKHVPRVIVGEIEMKRVMTPRGVQATANVIIKDLDGTPKQGARVSGRWSGLTKGTGSALTGKSGIATFSSSPSRLHGAFTFTVSLVSLPGFPYLPEKNNETSDTLSSR